MPHPFSKWSERPLSHSLYPGYERGLRTPVQQPFSSELAHCSNSVLHSNKLYFPLILSHVWKFFSNTSPDHKKGYYPITPVKICKTIKVPLKYEFLPYYSISLVFKIVIHQAEFSTLLTQITLLKMWHLGPLQNSWLRILFKKRKKKNFCFFDNLSYITWVGHWRINMLMLPWLFYNCSFI